MQLKNENAPAAATNSDEGGCEACTDESTARIAKRNVGNRWYEDGRRYLCSYGNRGTTVFDVWKLIGEPLPWRRRA